MQAHNRRADLANMLRESRQPLTGTTLAEALGVSRQVIVQDVALLRAQGEAIVATPRGYMFMSGGNPAEVTQTFAVQHPPTLAAIEQELTAIVDAGGHILDVIVEHPLYGELRGVLMIRSRSDVQDFLNQMTHSGAEPLSLLTEGVHLHTIAAPDIGTLARVQQALDGLGMGLHHRG